MMPLNAQIQRIFLSSLLLLGSLLHAQLLPDPLYKRDLRHERRGEAKVAILTNIICAGKDSTAQRTEAIYHWITHHIRYDKRAERKGLPRSANVWTTLKRHKATGLGYATLFESMCRQAGVPVATILGHAKGVDFRPGQRFLRGEHAWNAVQIGAEWRLVDACWGAGTTIIRRQPIRDWVFRKIDLPYVQRTRRPHQPNDNWLMTPASHWIHSHLPIDPKWQLQDTVLTLAAFEAIRDTARLPIIQDAASMIAASAGESPTRQALEEGKNGKAFNVKDDFDWAYAHVREGQLALFASPENGGDSIAWKKGIAEMEAAMPLLAEWMRRLGEEHRLRLKELRRLEVSSGRANAFTRGEWKFVQLDAKRLGINKTVTQNGRNEEASRFAMTTDKLRYIGPMPEDRPTSIKPHIMAKYQAQEDRLYEKIRALNDSLLGQSKILMSDISRLYIVSDSIERVRARILTRVAANRLLLMANAEKSFASASDTLAALSRMNHQRRKRYVKMSRAFYKECEVASTRAAQISATFAALHPVIRNMYVRGLPQDSVIEKLATAVQLHHSWAEAWEPRQEVPLMQLDLETAHIKLSEELLGKAIRLVGQEEWMIKKYLKRMRMAQQLRFKHEKALANHVRMRATAGRATLKYWVALARKDKLEMATK